MKIILVGYMGSGKSAVGKVLANRLNLSFIDLDDRIEKEMGMSISDIFREKGEIYFRKKEHESLAALLASDDDFVLSTGGGTPCYSGNMDLMLRTTPHLFYLRMSVSGLARRLEGEKDHRPMISHLNSSDLEEYIGKHLFERRNFYTLAPHTLPCDGKSIEEITDLITDALV